VAPVEDPTDWYEAPRKFSEGNIAMFLTWLGRTGTQKYDER